uniref:Bromo domain-containing protein n=1 Tax=Physcomitrium patens TaxID=3218 RepID=A0A7I4DNG5_PHYPA
MEGRRSRSKPAADVRPVDTPASPLLTKSAPKVPVTHVPPLQPKSSAKGAAAPVDTSKITVDDRCVPKVGGENKRKRAPRGPPGRNLKAKCELVNEDEAKAVSAPTADEEVLVSQSRLRESQGGTQVLRKVEDKSGTENDESVTDEGVNSKEKVEKRRGSSRLRIRPSKFRESLPISSSKVKGEEKSNEDSAKSIEVVLPVNAAIPSTAKSKENNRSTAGSSEVNTRELIARIFSKKKENKSTPTAVKDKELSTTAPVVPTIPDTVGLKAVLSALKRIMKMKEAGPFNKPVDPVKLGIPDYFEVVKRPMDLGTIRDRLEKGEVYNTVDDVFEDVALVWSNCRTYNDDGDPIMEFLKNLESTFQKLCLAAGFSFHAATATEVMAESKAREQKNKVVGANLGDQDRDTMNAVENSGGDDKQLGSLQAEQELDNDENNNVNRESLQGPVKTPPMKEDGSAPSKTHRKSTSSRIATIPPKVKRPNGHSTLTHRQGCLCVVCVGRRKREAKLRKSGGALSKAAKASKKKSGGPNSDDIAVEAEEDLPFTDDAEDALYGYLQSHYAQGDIPANYQLPLRKLDPYVVEMSRILLGSKPGSIWNRPRSLGYVSAPLPARSVGIADAISLFSKSH